MQTHEVQKSGLYKAAILTTPGSNTHLTQWDLLLSRYTYYCTERLLLFTNLNLKWPSFPVIRSFDSWGELCKTSIRKYSRNQHSMELLRSAIIVASLEEGWMKCWMKCCLALIVSRCIPEVRIAPCPSTDRVNWYPCPVKMSEWLAMAFVKLQVDFFWV